MSDHENRALFLNALRKTGKVTVAAKKAGLSRRYIYEQRLRSVDFSDDWDLSIISWTEDIDHRLMLTAEAMGLGFWDPVFDDDGEPVLDDDFEQVKRFNTDNVDPKVLIKLMSLRIPSANGPEQLGLPLNSSLPKKPTNKRPRLVFPALEHDGN